ncbi:MAG: hypothetical protein K9N47_22435 [Prosthecobacter sp.]|uniref:hypothetical protein n=1 Tax=Prosthecobacter sp. TaxID=1965333 RepID=UPI00260A367F|nr:hypothetical protein [Prosthecobacter sp.]MCF7788900.1 hypothetical protein [Prosthecobacter sp.]
MNLRLIPLALLLAVLAAQAQPSDPFAPNAVFNALPCDAPIASLPSGIPSTEGKVTLFADYARARKSEPMDVYLINRSDHDIVLGAQDGDVYLKLEAKNEDGTWTRVQPHAFSWCGNSYDFKSLVRKGGFYKIKGHQPKVGKLATIRFRLYKQDWLDLTTDAGEGVVSAEEAEKAATDALAVSTGSFDFVRDLATGENKIVNTMDHIQDMQGCAIETLGSGRFPKDKVLPLLDAIEKKFPEKKRDVNFARQSLEHPRKKQP